MTQALHSSAATLLLLPSVGIWQKGNGLYFDRKFFDGVLAYVKHWPGNFRVAMRLANSPPPAFGLVKLNPQDFRARFVLMGSTERIEAHHLRGVDMVLASGDSFDHFHLSTLCREQGVKCIYGIEYTLATRLQIEGLKSASRWQIFKSRVWLLLQEWRRLQAFRLADGLQANGVPAYESYAELVPSALQYFDTRNTAALGITDAELDARLAQLDENKPLRLGFSGRLIRLKGTDHLIEIAHRLQQRKIPFTLDIFGAGELQAEMQEKIHAYALAASVHLRGAVDFARELVPFIKTKVDVFVCCHRQSDPSCTYLETYACGVPIAGYDNRAHLGIVQRHDAGWLVAMNEVEGFVDLLARLHRERTEIKFKAINAVSFAREHTFETTFQRRITHCLEVLNEPLA